MEIGQRSSRSPAMNTSSSAGCNSQMMAAFPAAIAAMQTNAPAIGTKYPRSRSRSNRRTSTLVLD